VQFDTAVVAVDIFDRIGIPIGMGVRSAMGWEWAGNGK